MFLNLRSNRDHSNIAWKKTDGVRFVGLCEASKLFGRHRDAMVHGGYQFADR